MPPVPKYSATRDVDVLPSYHEILIPVEKLTRKELLCKLETLIVILSEQRCNTDAAYRQDPEAESTENLSFQICI